LVDEVAESDIVLNTTRLYTTCDRIYLSTYVMNWTCEI